MSANAARLWSLIVPVITCDFCGKKKDAPGSDDQEFADHLDKEGWIANPNDDRVKCPSCKKKRK